MTFIHVPSAFRESPRIRIMNFTILLVCSLVAGGCTQGPSDEVVLSDIRKALDARPNQCGLGKNTREIHRLEVVGRESEGKNISVHATANWTQTGPCTPRGNSDYEIVITYEKFGDSWRVSRYGFDFRRAPED